MEHNNDYNFTNIMTIFDVHILQQVYISVTNQEAVIFFLNDKLSKIGYNEP